MLKIAKNGLILHYVGSFGFSRIFSQVPPPIRLHPHWGPTGTENFESPIKNLEKKTLFVIFNLMCMWSFPNYVHKPSWVPTELKLFKWAQFNIILSYIWPQMTTDLGMWPLTSRTYMKVSIWAKSKTSVFATDGIWVTFSVVLNFLL